MEKETNKDTETVETGGAGGDSISFKYQQWGLGPQGLLPKFGTPLPHDLDTLSFFGGQ